jgi:hypothetical protein
MLLQHPIHRAPGGGVPGIRVSRSWEEEGVQFLLLSTDPDIAANHLHHLDLTTLTPLEVLNKLEELKRMVMGEEVKMVLCSRETPTKDT